MLEICILDLSETISQLRREIERWGFLPKFSEKIALKDRVGLEPFWSFSFSSVFIMPWKKRNPKKLQNGSKPIYLLELIFIGI